MELNNAKEECFMTINIVNPKQAFEKTQNDVPYLDVRTPEEFSQGRPQGSVNVPIMICDEQTCQMIPNPDFIAQVETQFSKDKPLVVGCKMGGRSLRACQILDSAGFKTLYNVDGGFDGNSETPGWAQEGLPVES